MHLLEREAELALLDRALGRARAGDGQVVLVGGEAGIGKSTLVERFVDRLGAQDLVLRGYCEPLATPSPLAPLYDIARQMDGAILHLLESSLERVALFSAILDKLRLQGRLVLLVFEDIHWADEATLAFIRYIARRMTGQRLMLVATYRDDEVGHHAMLRALLGALATGHAVDRMLLRRLSLDAVRTIAQGRTDAANIHRRTGGNPFFVHEMASQQSHDLPATVRDAVLARVEQLTPQARDFVEFAAIAGAKLEQAMLDSLPFDKQESLAACIAHGLLVQDGESIAFRHAIVRDAIFEALDPLRRRALSRAALTAAIPAATPGRAGYAQLAELAEGAGDSRAVIEYAGAAAAAAAALGAHREAHAQYARLIRFAQTLPAGERAHYRYRHAEECALIDNLDSAIASYAAAADLWKEAGDVLRQGDALARMAWPLVRNGENDRAEEAVATAIRLLSPLGDTLELGIAYRFQAHLRMLDRDRAEAIRLGEMATAICSRFNDPAAVAAAEIVVGSAKLVFGDDAGRAHIDRAIVLAGNAASERDALLTLAYVNLGTSYGEQYRFDDAERFLNDGIAFARERDLDHHEQYMTSWLAMTRLFQGRLSEAAQLAELVLAHSNVAVISRIMALATLGRVRARRGETGADAVLDEALAYAEATDTLQRLAPVRAARAELAWLSGDADRTRREASAVFDLAASRQHQWHVGELSYWRRQAGDAVAGFPWVAAPYAAHLRDDWRAAAEAWNRLGCPYEQARALSDGDAEAQLQALEIFDGLGAAPAAAALRRRMRAAGSRHVPRGHRASTRQNPFGLTNREIATLRELALGLTNAEIGDKLFISPKTVDHHVSAILAKLGVATRYEAAELARAQKFLG
jgi:DNA-binding CsgD family transcriptional regulator